MIHIHDYNIPDIKDYGSELKKEYSLLDVQKATWITTKNITFAQLPLTFKEKEPPIFIEIPGEQAKTEVSEYYERPMSSNTCLRYGHTVKICHETIATCARCSYQGHKKDKCTSTEVRYCHCGEDSEDLQVFSRNCPIFKREI